MTSATSPALAAALAYAAKGWPILPCNAAGRPLTLRGIKAASSDREKIERWWTRWPDALPGLPLGKISGAMVLEFQPADGLSGMERAIKRGNVKPGRPGTLVATTPDGVARVFFRHYPDADRLPRDRRDMGDGVRIMVLGDVVPLPTSLNVLDPIELKGFVAARAAGMPAHAGTETVQ